MSKEKIASYIGFAVKSMQIDFGLDKITSGHSKGFLIIFDTTLSENAAKKLTFYAESKKIPLIKTTDRIEILVNKTNCKAIAIKNKNLTKAILENIDSNYLLISGGNSFDC